MISRIGRLPLISADVVLERGTSVAVPRTGLSVAAPDANTSLCGLIVRSVCAPQLTSCRPRRIPVLGIGRLTQPIAILNWICFVFLFVHSIHELHDVNVVHDPCWLLRYHLIASARPIASIGTHRSDGEMASPAWDGGKPQ
jgi:hypothetical protein